MIQKLFTLIKLILELPLVIVYYISGVIPKDASIWVIGSYHGKYIDNSKYLFERETFKYKKLRIFSNNNKNQLISIIKEGSNIIHPANYFTANQYQANCIDIDFIDEKELSGKLEFYLLPNSEIMYYFY